MTEPARFARNVAKLQECHPVFRNRVAVIIQRMQLRGFRPRIQEAARSPKAQLEAVKKGTSKVTFSFHNATDAQGRPSSWAVDMLDDDSPLDPSLAYVMALAIEARKVKCRTGILFSVSTTHATILNAAISADNVAPAIKKKDIGWDPTHIEPTDLSLVDAKRGTQLPKDKH